MDKGKNTKVKCSKCGREEKVNFSHCLVRGWPKCCGYTMTLVATRANIEKATEEAIRSTTIIRMETPVINGMKLVKEEKLYE